MKSNSESSDTTSLKSLISNLLATHVLSWMLGLRFGILDNSRDYLDCPKGSLIHIVDTKSVNRTDCQLYGCYMVSSIPLIFIHTLPILIWRRTIFVAFYHTSSIYVNVLHADLVELIQQVNCIVCFIMLIVATHLSCLS